MNRLTLHIDSSRVHYPKVRLLIDGEDLLASTGRDEGNDPGEPCSRRIRHGGSPSTASRPEAAHWSAHDGEAITLDHRAGGTVRSIDLLLPPGPADRVAASLVALLDAGTDPRRIAAEQLWRKASVH